MKEGEGKCELDKHNVIVIYDDIHFSEEEGITFSVLLKVKEFKLLSFISHIFLKCIQIITIRKCNVFGKHHHF